MHYVFAVQFFVLYASSNPPYHCEIAEIRVCPESIHDDSFRWRSLVMVAKDMQSANPVLCHEFVKCCSGNGVEG